GLQKTRQPELRDLFREIPAPSTYAQKKIAQFRLTHFLTDPFFKRLIFKRLATLADRGLRYDPVMRPLQKCLVAALAFLTIAAAPSKTRNIILVTADGLRWQDLFGGLDPLLKDEKSAGMDKAAAVKTKFWRASPDERRRA